MEIIDDADIQVSQGQARFILEIPGYELFKPIEITLFAESSLYRAQHTLPSGNGGYELCGSGDSEEAAAKDFISRLVQRYENPVFESERIYLTSIMSKQEE